MYDLAFSRIFNISYALSKWPHLHRAYVIGVYIFFATAVFYLGLMTKLEEFQISWISIPWCTCACEELDKLQILGALGGSIRVFWTSLWAGVQVATPLRRQHNSFWFLWGEEELIKLVFVFFSFPVYTTWKSADFDDVTKQQFLTMTSQFWWWQNFTVFLGDFRIEAWARDFF